MKGGTVVMRQRINILLAVVQQRVGALNAQIEEISSNQLLAEKLEFYLQANYFRDQVTTRQIFLEDLQAISDEVELLLQEFNSLPQLYPESTGAGDPFAVKIARIRHLKDLVRQFNLESNKGQISVDRRAEYEGHCDELKELIESI